MKKTFKFAVAAIAIVGAASCTKEFTPDGNSQVEENLVKITFTAGMEDTKAYLDGKQVCWEEGDSIAVWDGTKARSFKAVSVSGSQAEFSGEVDASATNFQAVAPYTAFKEVVEDTIKYTVPATQYIGKNSSAKDVLVSVASTSDLSAGLQFKNVVSLVKFTFSADGGSSLVLSSTGTEPIVGTGGVLEDGDIDVLSGTSKLTVLPEAGTLAAGTYYAAVLPSELYKGLTLVYGSSTEKGKISTANFVEFVANSGVDLGTVDTNAKAVKAPFTITTTDELLAFGELMSYFVAGETVKLGNDISLSGKTWNGGTFRGNLDGQGHSITNISIENAGDAAFINNLYGVVKDLKFGSAGDGSVIRGTSATTGSPCVAAIGIVGTGGQLTNVENYATVEVDTIGMYVGGLCARYNSALKISGCKNHGAVTHRGPSTNTINLAGLVSNIGVNTTVENCENDGVISYAGTKPASTVNHAGLVGYTSQPIVFTNCKNSGEVKVGSEMTAMAGKIYRIGGIVGLNQGTGVTMENCDNSGNLTVAATGFSKQALYMGGLIGQNESKSTTGITLRKCTNSGELTSSITGNSGFTAIGGMVGYRAMSSNSGALGIAQLDSCVNTGNILDCGTRSATGTSSYLAGMIAYNLMGANLKGCVNGEEGETCGSITKNTPASASANVCSFAAISAMIGWQGAPATSDYSSSTVSLTGCHNYAAISNIKDGGTTYLYLASMIAANEPTKVSEVEKYYSVTIDNCVNDGVVSNLATGKSQVRMGGFIGDGANIFTLKNSTNNGEVSSSCAVTSATIQYRVGGFVGSITKGTSGKHVFTDLVNTGNVSAVNTSSSVTATAISAGGILGFLGIASNKFTNCSSNAAISASGKATKTYVKAILGNTTKACTITDCSLAGSCNGEAITSENFSDYVWASESATAPTVTVSGTTFISE